MHIRRPTPSTKPWWTPMSEQPNPSVYEPSNTFICGSGGCNVTPNHLVKPERQIAGNLLEETDSWMSALEREQVPPRVLLGIRAARAAALWWVTDLDKARPSGNTP